MRARIIVLSWGGLRVTTIAAELGCHTKTVRWRLRRFNDPPAETARRHGIEVGRSGPPNSADRRCPPAPHPFPGVIEGP
ncbi:helix-turn-helix domain-containing protein [Streptomyces subrutilus]|uniref:helix-turn-helix domain-containing protein n=1 Tax=Streptomyces subrutilus TaxID=36818 RepID=UPI0034099E2A